MHRTIALLALAAWTIAPAPARSEERKPSFEAFGFAQVDYIQDFKRMPSDWNATLRPTRIPTTSGAEGSDGEAILSARQSRLGVRGSFPAGAFDLKARLEADFFGRGTGQPDSAGQNTIRLRRAYGEWGPVLGGLTASLFMDDDWWPNVIDYWGPCGMVFFRNVQIRYTFFTGEHTLAVALERPGADVPNYTTVEGELAADNKLPDLTGQYRYAQPWGYVQLSGILRRLGYDTRGSPDNQPKGDELGWGGHASSTIKLRPDKLHLLVAIVGGAGIENYMNDATPDLAASGSATAPSAAAVKMLGVAAYADVYWTPLLTSSFGYSTTKIWNTNLQAAGAFEQGQYVSGNLLVHPARNFLVGPEFLWGKREDKGGASGTDARLQISLKYSFSSLDLSKPG